MKTLVYSERR